MKVEYNPSAFIIRVKYCEIYCLFLMNDWVIMPVICSFIHPKALYPYFKWKIPLRGSEHLERGGRTMPLIIFCQEDCYSVPLAVSSLIVTTWGVWVMFINYMIELSKFCTCINCDYNRQKIKGGLAFILFFCGRSPQPKYHLRWSLTKGAISLFFEGILEVWSKFLWWNPIYRYCSYLKHW